MDFQILKLVHIKMTLVHYKKRMTLMILMMKMISIKMKKIKNNIIKMGMKIKMNKKTHNTILKTMVMMKEI